MIVLFLPGCGFHYVDQHQPAWLQNMAKGLPDDATLIDQGHVIYTTTK